MRMNDLYEEPFTDIGLTEDDFMHLEDVKDKSIRILAVKTYTKDDSPGAFIAFMLEDGSKKYIATHAKGLVAVAGNGKLQAALEAGETLDTKIVYRKSTKSDRMVYAFI